VSAERPGAVLFMCSMNSVRSPMAEALLRRAFGKSIYVASAGVRKGEPDGFVREVMDEVGADVSKHRVKTLEELEDWEGLSFDLVVSLSPEAHHRALELTRTNAIDVEYWPTMDPTLEQGSRDQRLEAYRMARDGLWKRIRQRFGAATGN
jgi:protein-tyrosine-phosphatase